MLFVQTDYRALIAQQFKNMPKGGYGQARRLAEYLNVHTTLISQVLKGKKTLTLDQAAGVADFLELTEIETDYFLLLVQLDRAGTPALKKKLNRQLDKLRAQSKDLSHRLTDQHKLKEEERATFYSDWAYSAIRQLTAIPGYHNVENIAHHLGLTRTKTKNYIDFLLSVGLCIEDQGQLKVGPAMTHLETSSKWVRVHRMNWRQKGLDALDRESPSQLHYSAPMTLSQADAERLRELILGFLEKVDDVVGPSPSEVLYCLNVDWFEVR